VLYLRDDVGDEGSILGILRGHSQKGFRLLRSKGFDEVSHSHPLKKTMPAVNFISTLPNFTSQDEHTTLVGSTPNSFTDIPPVLRYKEEGVSVVLEPELEGFSNAQGTLYVLTRSVAFFLIGYPFDNCH
jgi:hypothetical protein